MPPEYFFENKDPKLESRPRRFFLFLDFDGTLVPIQNDPTKCVLSPGIKGLLDAIALSGKACIAILSGRTVNDIKERVHTQGIYYGGNHGLEISGPNLRFVHPHVLQGNRIINKICQTIHASIDNMDGVFIERKKFSISLHYRMADKEGKTLIKKIFSRIISGSPSSQTFSVLRGKKVLELVPSIQWDKGKAALFLLQKEKKKYLPIYVGDDLTDETAFKTLNQDGITIRVGRSKKTAAKYYLKGQWEVSRFLKHLYNFMQQE